MGGFGGDILSTLGISPYPRRMSPSWNPRAGGVRPETLGNPVGTPIPMNTDPTLQTMDVSGTGIGPGSAVPPNTSPASTTAYEQTLANPPQRRGGLRGALGTATEIIGGVAGVPAISQAGTRLSWGASTPGGARTPEEYQANLQRLAAMSQIDQRNQTQQYLNLYRQERIDNQRQAQAFQRQKDLENQQAKFEAWQGKSEELPQVGDAIKPTPTPSAIPTTMVGRSMPPAFDPGTGGTVPVSGRPDEQGQLVTQVNPTTQQPETRFQPSAATLRTRNLAATAAQKQAEMVTLPPNVDRFAADNYGYQLGGKYPQAQADKIQAAFDKSNELGKVPTPDKTVPVDQQLLQSDVDAQAVKEGKKPGGKLSDLSAPGQAAVQAAYKARQAAPDAGSWTLGEDSEGKPLFYNTKTLETRPAPGGIQKTGTAQKAKDALAKETEPVDTAVSYANDYMKNRMYTAAGDEALMEKYFEVAKPSTGFRMTQVQTEMLNKGRSWLEGAKANIAHKLTPNAPYYSDVQRQQIVDTMNALARAKKASIAAARGSQGQPSGPNSLPGGITLDDINSELARRKQAATAPGAAQ